MKFIIRAAFIFLFLTSILEFSLGVDISSIPGVSLKNLSIYFLIILLIILNLKRGIPIIQKNPINIPIILFVIYSFISLLLTFKHDPSFYGSMSSEIIFFKSFMDPFLLSIVVYSLVHDSTDIDFLIFTLLTLLLVFNLLSILGSFYIFDVKRIFLDPKWGRTTGAFSEPNQYAAYLALFLPITFCAYRNSHSIFGKTVMAVTLLSSIYCLLLTGSRGGILSLMAGVAALVFINAKRISAELLLKIFLALSIAALVLLVTFSLLPQQSQSGIERNVVYRAHTQDIDEYSSGRLKVWKFAIRDFLANPIFGTGWRTFVGRIGINSHNDYILYLTTLGLTGFYPFILIFYRLFISVNSFRKSVENNSWYYNGYLAGLISFCTSMFFVNIYNPFFFFFIFSSLILKKGYLQNST